MSAPEFPAAPPDGWAGPVTAPKLPPRAVPPAPAPREWFALAELVAQAVHQQSHALHAIARDLAAIRAKLDALAPVAEGLARGGRFGAWTAARSARKEGGTPP